MSGSEAPELSSFQLIYQGFEHAGLRLEVDRARAKGGATAYCRVIDVQTGELGGVVIRCFEERDGRPIVQGAGYHLQEAYRRRGFTRAFLAYEMVRYPELGVYAHTVSARSQGGAAWARLGFDFDLYEINGPDEGRRRARAVAEVFSPDAPRPRRWRRVPKFKEPNPYSVLRARQRRRGASARAAREMWDRIPTEEQIESGDLDGTFTTPAEIVAFEAHGIRLGEEAMLRSEWKGINVITP